MAEPKNQKLRVGKLSPMEIAVQKSVQDIVSFHTYLDVIRGVYPYQNAKTNERINAYNEMQKIKQAYPRNPALVNKMDEAERFIKPYLKALRK
jgi:hypothetical protein